MTDAEERHRLQVQDNLRAVREEVVVFDNQRPAPLQRERSIAEIEEQHRSMEDQIRSLRQQVGFVFAASENPLLLITPPPPSSSLERKQC